MKKVLKWIGIGLGALVGLLVLALVVLYFLGSTRLNKRYDIQVETITIPSDETAIARGRHLSEAVTLCQACHGEDLEGDVIDNEPQIAIISAPNLTSGEGGVAATYNDADWVRAIRHGVNPEGRGLILMHSDVYHNLSEEDLGAVIAFLKSAPPMDSDVPITKAEPLGKIFVALGMFDIEGMPLIPAEVIDHSAPVAEMSAQESTAEYGKYLLSITVCSMCHGSDLTGRPPLEPGSPPGPDITPGGRLSSVSQQDFISLFRTRGTAESEYMPWDVYAKMTDEELGAIWLYLTSLKSE
jgi:cytochrome c553